MVHCASSRHPAAIVDDLHCKVLRDAVQNSKTSFSENVRKGTGELYKLWKNTVFFILHRKRFNWIQCFEVQNLTTTLITKKNKKDKNTFYLVLDIRFHSQLLYTVVQWLENSLTSGLKFFFPLDDLVSSNNNLPKITFSS